MPDDSSLTGSLQCLTHAEGLGSVHMWVDHNEVCQCGQQKRIVGTFTVPSVQESGWQPIATAPKGYDGRRFTHVLFYGVSAGRSFDHPVVVSGWMDSDRRPVYYYQYKLRITHWMPWPTDPQ